MARILVHPHPQHRPLLQTQTLVGPGHFLLRQTPLLPGAGVRPFLWDRIANGLLLPILTYGADLLTPNYAAFRGMNGFWHRGQRWTTNNFLSTPTSILSRAACLPPIVSYCRYQRRLATLRIACAPPYANPASAGSHNPSPPSPPCGPRTLPGTL